MGTKIPDKKKKSGWALCICMVIVIAPVLFAGAACGGIVSGAVERDNIQQAGKMLEFNDDTRGTSVRTRSDKRGKYIVLLPPGFFEVRIDGHLCGRVQSSSQPVTFNIDMISCR